MVKVSKWLYESHVPCLSPQYGSERSTAHSISFCYTVEVKIIILKLGVLLNPQPNALRMLRVYCRATRFHWVFPTGFSPLRDGQGVAAQSVGIRQQLSYLHSESKPLLVSSCKLVLN